LKMRSIVAKGKEADMLAQLKKPFADKVPINTPLKTAAKKRESKKSNSLASIFQNDAYRKVLVSQKDITEEPYNPRWKQAHAPTIVAEDEAYVLVKHNFNDTFERSEFKVKYEEVQRFPNGLLKKSRDGTTMTDTKPRTKGCIKPSFIKANKITSHSHPADFVLPFFLSRKIYIARRV